jgi:hypothetical protein
VFLNGLWMVHFQLVFTKTFWDVCVFWIPWGQTAGSKTQCSWAIERIFLQSSIQDRSKPFLV